MQELRTVQITDDDEMEISDDERDYDRRGPSAKRIRYDSEGLKVRKYLLIIYIFCKVPLNNYI